MTAAVTTCAPFRARIGILLALALAAPVLVGCSEFHRLSSEEALDATTPARAHPVPFVDRDEFLDIEIPPGRRHLSRNQYVDVYRFAVRYREESTGPLIVSPPPGRQADRHASPAVSDIRRALQDGGVDPSRIVPGTPAKGSVLTLAYQRPLAVAPQCGHWPKDVGRNGERVPYPDFGCATQRNFAGMVANSRDIIGSQGESQPASERRDRVWSQYVSGGQVKQQAGGAAAEPTGDAKAKPAR